ncbi:hypothetical protein GIB67_002016 [Kingdonia uniflora]|uniref:Pentatricopeptide repeat-containing protein n=1 Tax=Kingdonia uniflora TaxID=39325 RepID=A0A7J7MA20_9MAGN|nr:hypothetical protein GIB67_002016 [Kingdonia uniflora]
MRNSLVMMYTQSGDILSSELVFEGIVDKNIVSWTVMVGGYVQNGLYKEGLSIFRRMVSSGTQPNAVTLMSILPACIGLNFLNFGKLIHGYGVKLGLDSDIPLVNSLIALYGKCKDVKRARSLFDQMDTRDLVSWNAMIVTYEQSGFTCTSLGAVSMGEWVHEPVIMIGACGNHGHGKVAHELFSNMVEEGVRPNMFTITVVLTTSRHSDLLEEGKKYYESMIRHYSVLPGIEHCACLVDLLGHADLLVEAYEFIKRIPVKPDDCVWGALLGAYRVHGNLEFAELVAEHLFILDPQNTTYYILMWNMYANAGSWEDVETLKKLMNEKELKKIPSHSLVEIDKRFFQLLSMPKLCPL